MPKGKELFLGVGGQIMNLQRRTAGGGRRDVGFFVPVGRQEGERMELTPCPLPGRIALSSFLLKPVNGTYLLPNDCQCNK